MSHSYVVLDSQEENECHDDLSVRLVATSVQNNTQQGRPERERELYTTHNTWNVLAETANDYHAVRWHCQIFEDVTSVTTELIYCYVVMGNYWLVFISSTRTSKKLWNIMV